MMNSENRASMSIDQQAVHPVTLPSGVTGITGVASRRLRIAAIAICLAAVAAGIAAKRGGWVQPDDPVSRFLIAVTVALAICHLGGFAASRVGQPWVVGELFGAVAVGPSLLGLVWPSGQSWVFAPAVVRSLSMVAQLGLALFMFLLGCDLRTRDGASRPGRVTAVIAGAMGIPFCVGIAAAAPTQHFMAGRAGTAGYLLFTGLALSITAVPVLARILGDLNIEHTRIGTLALASAAIGDGVVWVTVALVLIVVGTGGGPWEIVAHATAAGFLGIAVLAARPMLGWIVRRLDGRADRLAVPALTAGAIGFAALTELIGLHPVIGAFLFGAILPRDVPIVATLSASLRGFTVTILLPLFFVSVGLSTSVLLLGSSASRWGVFGLLLATAIAAKFAGAAGGGRLAGLRGRDLGRLGALMNCRGVTELIVISIGYESHMISGFALTVFVLIALLTTLAATPLVRWFGLPQDL